MANNGINKFLNFLKLTDEDEYDEDFYDDYDGDAEDEKELRKEEKRLQREQKREEKKSSLSRNMGDYDTDDDYDYAPISSRKTSAKTGTGKVVPIRTTSSDLEVCIIKPSNFGESQQVCEILLGGQPVVVNLEGIDIEEAQRIMDFISGCIFSVSGNMRQVSRYIFIFSPKNIDISGDYIKNVAESEEGINIPTLNKEF